MKTDKKHKELFTDLTEKSVLKQKVYNTTLSSFKNLKKVIDSYEEDYHNFLKREDSLPKTPFEAKQNGEFEIEMKFGGDILIFMMHSNVFEFPRGHEVMKTPYVKEDKTRSYHGIINIYNFLSDSFKYYRQNDIGYLIGRIFINKDNSYFIEGKRELSYLFNFFGSRKFDDEAIDELLDAAIRYTINFDLLTPHYDQIKEVSVMELKSAVDSISLKTGKRLGFKFQSDDQNINQ